MVQIYDVFCFSALVKLLNKSIEGTADDDEEGVTPDTAIRSGLELLKVHSEEQTYCNTWEQMLSIEHNIAFWYKNMTNERLHVINYAHCFAFCRSCHSPTPQPFTQQKPTSPCFSV